jgi:hypothetical protein
MSTDKRIPIDIELGPGSTERETAITLKGDSAAIVDVLVNGLPTDALEQLTIALDGELDKRGLTSPGRSR